MTADFLCGSIAGSLATACSMPFDVIRTRMVVSQGYRNLLHPINKTWTKEGIGGFFHGLTPSLAQIALNAASGALAGIVAKTITINERIRPGAFGQTTAYGGMMATIRGIIKHEGFTSLYKGIWPALLKESTQTALSFFFYELACDILSGSLFNSK
uniref:Mitochondrial carrier protein n=1 Tax=Meloidogyne hapla TaxID=6305 RepID=A0A1I8BW61_MELHA